MRNDNKDLRNALTDYFGTAMYAGNPAAVVDLIRVQQASDQELLRTALSNGFPLSAFCTEPFSNSRE